MFFDPTFFMFALPGLILAGIASIMTSGTFNKYSRVRSAKGLTGAEAARRLLTGAGINDVKIEQVGGFLSDHYDPSAKVLRLSPKVYGEDSLSAIGVACHEAGHALQHAQGYVWLNLRSAMVPAVNISSQFSYIVLIGGFMLSSFNLIFAGIILFSASVLFSIITLPVEWDASSRAKLLMVQCGAVDRIEAKSAGAVLNAAFLTYLAAAISSALTLLYYLYRAGLIGSRR
ncbi:MAG: zinc metallopeptidase [Chitinivibrionia bacterium]|jgi:Zn-dependent membrane protease YugP|nr:zinc metallopeptidase [Chitinivibrionia bacterium]